MMLCIMRFLLVMVGLGMGEPPQGLGETDGCKRDRTEIRPEWATHGS